MDPDRKLRRFNKLAASRKYKSQKILRTLKIRPGAVVADIGSGGGYYTQAFARATAPNGLAVAVDVNPRYLEYIQHNAQQQGLTNVETFLTPVEQLKLPTRKFDWVFMRNMYHHLPDPSTYFQYLSIYLKKTSLVVIIDYKRAKGFALSFSSRRYHFSDPEAIQYVMHHCGLELFRSFDDFLPNQSFQIFNLRR